MPESLKYLSRELPQLESLGIAKECLLYPGAGVFGLGINPSKDRCSSKISKLGLDVLTPAGSPGFGWTRKGKKRRGWGRNFFQTNGSSSELGSEKGQIELGAGRVAEGKTQMS